MKFLRLGIIAAVAMTLILNCSLRLTCVDISGQLVVAQLLVTMWFGGRESRTPIDIAMSAHTASARCGPSTVAMLERHFKRPGTSGGGSRTT